MNRHATWDASLEAAVDWLVVMRSGCVSHDEARRFQAWHAASPEHARAWDEVSAAVIEPLAPLQGPERAAAGAVLRRPAARRRFLGRALGTGAGILVLGAAARHLPWDAWAADLRTGTGQRLARVLDDGSQIALNACSAVDVDFSSQARRLNLLSGSVLVAAAPDPARPFIVATDYGEVRALGTRFMVSREEDTGIAVVLEHAVEVSAAGQRRVLPEGAGLRFGPQGISDPDARLMDKAAWRSGMLVARNESLGDVIRALRPYRPGMLRISPEAARLRVLGAFPLDDPDASLASLVQTLPLRVQTYGPWLAWVDVARPDTKK